MRCTSKCGANPHLCVRAPALALSASIDLSTMSQCKAPPTNTCLKRLHMPQHHITWQCPLPAHTLAFSTCLSIAA
eukprot:300241-Chlamydomonas_euryale.AAC.4